MFYAKCFVSLWQMIAIRHMKPHAFAVPFTNALVEIAIFANKPLPFLAFLPTLALYVGSESKQMV